MPSIFSIPSQLAAIARKCDEILLAVREKCDSAKVLAAIQALQTRLGIEFGEVDGKLDEIIMALTPSHGIAAVNPSFGTPVKSKRRA